MSDLSINPGSAMETVPGFVAPVSLFFSSPLSPYHAFCLPLPALFSLHAPAMPPHSPSPPLFSATFFSDEHRQRLLKDGENAFTLRRALHLAAGAEAGLVLLRRETEKPAFVAAQL